MNRKPLLASVCLFAASLVLSTPTFAQMGGPGMGGGEHREMRGGPGGGMHMGPGGMWWKNPRIVTALALTPEQQKKMSDIFESSRIQLIDAHANVEKAEVPMQSMLAANPPETSKVLAQIDKIAQARAELEKANAKMLLGIRGVLTPDQWTKLQAEEHSHRGGMEKGRGEMKGREGRGPGGPGGMGHGPMGNGQMPPAPPTE
ncbi:protein refolding chaperone Spy/CpxP family [Granulicella rosea]|uniref:Protein refolding chaperone Spy/CpxP family n=1 Tax=Granulicella rosea TaxID=474952 RepID=A0A239CPC3_9BACT|nr:Spy/CpxP family protein refolding chaperone [Granulicella rosea]SNS21344.1 protein refolding chaperone Spy/CpxP family [Granulicella rosea]